MKFIVPSLFMLIIFGCGHSIEENGTNAESSNSSLSENDTVVTENTTAEINQKVGLDFLNSYVENCNKMKNAIGIIDWTSANRYATENLKTELQKLINTDGGLDFDPFFDAQDYPEEGVELSDFNSETGYLIVQGVNWESFKITMKVINQNGQSMVDGCGIVNIPLDKRAER